MTAEKKKSAPRNALLDSLCETYPVLRECKPLALGIHKAIQARMPEVKADELRLAMRIHTASTPYLKALLVGKERFDLDGQVAGEVTDEHRQVADASLQERFKKVAERRKAEAKKQREAEKQKVEQEKTAKRQEKLAQLAAKFNNR